MLVNVFFRVCTCLPMYFFRSELTKKNHQFICRYEPRHEKTKFYICENKDADQLRGDREADQRLCFRYIYR